MPRFVEVLLAGCLVLLLLPAAGLAAGLVRLALGRPVLFRQVRAGRNGRPIVLRKFRTMRDDRDAEGRLLPDEARLTATGRLLRRYRIDELPQLLAVLRGDLGLVGPRPLLPDTVASFGAAGRERGAVRPGLTGWAQVSGNTRLSDTEKLQLDLWYVGHRSAWLDAAILGLTVLTILRGEARSEARIRRARLWCLSRDQAGAVPVGPELWDAR